MRVILDRKHRDYRAVANHLPSVVSSLCRIGVKLKRRHFSYQAFSKNIAKIALGIFVLSFFSVYQPSQNLFPLKKITVKAQEPTQQTQTVTPAQTDIQFQLPHPGYISTVFSGYHPGIDIATGLGMPVKPIAKGVVVEAGYNFWGLGLMVEIEHSGGYRSLYAHMGKIYVQKDKQVDVNDLLGEVGLTGNTSGPHTHLELSRNGRKIDPRPLLPEIRIYPQEQDFVVHNSATPSAVLIPASASAQVKPDPLPEKSPESKLPVLESLNEVKEQKTEEIKNLKQELAQKSLETILTVTKPTPAASPSIQPPKGGKIALLDFKTLLGLRK